MPPKRTKTKRPNRAQRRDEVSFQLVVDEEGNTVLRPISIPRHVQSQQDLVNLLPEGFPVDVIENHQVLPQQRFTREDDGMSAEDRAMIEKLHKGGAEIDLEKLDFDGIGGSDGDDDDIDMDIDHDENDDDFEPIPQLLDQEEADYHQEVMKKRNEELRTSTPSTDLSRVFMYDYNKHFKPMSGIGTFISQRGGTIENDPEVQEEVIPAIPENDDDIMDDHAKQVAEKIQKDVAGYVLSEASGLQLPVLTANQRYKFSDDFLYPLETGETDEYEEIEDNIFELLMQSDDEHDDNDQDDVHHQSEKRSAKKTSSAADIDADYHDNYEYNYGDDDFNYEYEGSYGGHDDDEEDPFAFQLSDYDDEDGEDDDLAVKRLQMQLEKKYGPRGDTFQVNRVVKEELSVGELAHFDTILKEYGDGFSDHHGDNEYDEYPDDEDDEDGMFDDDEDAEYNSEDEAGFAVNMEGLGFDSAEFRDAMKEFHGERQLKKKSIILSTKSIEEKNAVIQYNKEYIQRQQQQVEPSMRKIERMIDRSFERKKKDDFDVESVLSTYTNVDNIPTMIKEVRVRAPKKTVSTASSQKRSKKTSVTAAAAAPLPSIGEEENEEEIEPQTHIQIGATGVVLGVMQKHRVERSSRKQQGGASQDDLQSEDDHHMDDHDRQELGGDDDDEEELDSNDPEYLAAYTSQVGRKKNETKEERKARKNAIKQQRAARRQERKLVADIFKEEKKHQRKNEFTTKMYNAPHKKL